LSTGAHLQFRVSAPVAQVPHFASPAWTFTAIDADTKLIVSWLVGHRTKEHAVIFMKDLASRLANRVQLTTDGHHMYLPAVAQAFHYDVDFAQIVKTYGQPAGGEGPERRYSPPICLGTSKTWISGEPIESEISTSFVERANLNMRMNMRRMTRLTNGFSKKLENHAHAVAVGSFSNMSSFARTGHLRRGTESSPSRAP